MTSLLHLELTAPQTIDLQRVPYQSFWLLVRLCYAQQYEPAPGVVRLAELRQQFTDVRSLRMFISRAFKDFARWGIQVGWGEDTSGDPRFLSLDKRSQGPFWLAQGEAAKMQLTVQQAPARQLDCLSFLGLKQREDSGSKQPLTMPADFWISLAAAQQDLRQGRLLATLAPATQRQSGALAGFKEAARLADNRLQQSLAALGQAQVWRRLDDLDAARQTLTQLRRALREGGADAGGYLDAMEQILSAWCAYTQRELSLAQALLAAMCDAEPRASVVRYHPRIRFEWHNLMALIHRAHALAQGQVTQRSMAAREAMHHFATALDAAFEFGSFDAAQQLAANVGLAAWLFAGEGLLEGQDAASARPEALRWLLLSEKLCHCAGLTGQSAWNAIYLMRIARGHCPKTEHPTLSEFCALQALDPAAVKRSVDASAWLDIDTLLPGTWLALAEQLLASQEHGQSRYSLLQRCSLWLEHAWYAAHAGKLDVANQSLSRLDAASPALPASDRAYFAESRRCLPQELIKA